MTKTSTLEGGWNGPRVVVRAIFTTSEGHLRYAVENEGTLDFVEEARLSPSAKSNLAA